MEDLEKAARQQGVSFEDFKANIRNGILTQQVVRDEVGRHLQMTQGQEQAYYDAHKQGVRSAGAGAAERDPCSHACRCQRSRGRAGAGEGGRHRSQSEGRREVRGVSQEPTPADRRRRRAATSASSSAARSAKVLEDQTFYLQAGGVTAPIRTRQGFVILKVTDHQEAGVPPLKDIEPQIQEAMYYAGHAACAACLPDQAARRGVHRHQARLRGLRRKPAADQAGLHVPMLRQLRRRRRCSRSSASTVADASQQ